MVRGLRVAHGSRHAKRGPDGACGDQCTIGGERPKPIDPNIINHEKRARGDHAQEQVVVERELVHRACRKSVEIGAEPDILANDFACGLCGSSVLENRVGKSPAVRAARTRFLWNC